MKIVIDNYFNHHLNRYSDFFVIAADMGFFSARHHKNFKDLGNREEAVGSVVMGLLDAGANVVIYECSGFILRKLLNDLQFYLPYSKGSLKIVSYGSGFAYNKSGNGHYPFDDLHIAKLLGLDIYIPSCKHELATMLPLVIDLSGKHSFIRIHDNDKCLCCEEISKDFSNIPDLPYLIIPGNLTPFFIEQNEKIYNLVTYGDKCSSQDFEKYSEDKQKFKVYNSVIVEDQKPFILLGSDIKRFSCDYSMNFWHDDRNRVFDAYLPRKEIFEYLKTL